MAVSVEWPGRKPDCSDGKRSTDVRYEQGVRGIKTHRLLNYSGNESVFEFLTGWENDQSPVIVWTVRWRTERSGRWSVSTQTSARDQRQSSSGSSCTSLMTSSTVSVENSCKDGPGGTRVNVNARTFATLSAKNLLTVSGSPHQWTKL